MIRIIIGCLCVLLVLAGIPYWQDKSPEVLGTSLPAFEKLEIEKIVMLDPKSPLSDEMIGAYDELSGEIDKADVVASEDHYQADQDHLGRDIVWVVRLGEPEALDKALVGQQALRSLDVPAYLKVDANQQAQLFAGPWMEIKEAEALLPRLEQHLGTKAKLMPYAFHHGDFQ